ncbi:MAG: peroxide stress protein YaaA [Bacillota bacterium]
MKIIISPAKKMKQQFDIIENTSTPIFQSKAEHLSAYIKSLCFDDLKSLFKANDAITMQNFERYQQMDFQSLQTPAILAYDGIQYKYMAPAVFEDGNFVYAQDKVRILSGLYGVLKPLDSVVQYRLEMQAKLEIDGNKNLYAFWGDSIYNAEFLSEEVIINLASKEYSKSISKYITKTQKWIDIIFGEVVDGKIIEKGVYVKMARGEMIRFMAEHNIQEETQMKKFNRLGYIFSSEHSTDNKYVFIKEKKND